MFATVPSRLRVRPDISPRPVPPVLLWRADGARLWPVPGPARRRWGGGAVAALLLHVALALMVLRAGLRDPLPPPPSEMAVELAFAPPPPLPPMAAPPAAEPAMVEPAAADPAPALPPPAAEMQEVPDTVPEPATTSAAPKPAEPPPPPQPRQPAPPRHVTAAARPAVAAPARPAAPPRVVASPSSPAPPLSAPPLAAPPPPAAARVDGGWARDVVAWLQSRRAYPEAARRRGEQGTTLLRLTILHDGHVSEVVLLKGSGSARLDAAAQALAASAALPAFPASMAQAQTMVDVPIRFVLE